MKNVFILRFIFIFLAGIFISQGRSIAQDRTEGNKSPVPKYSFSSTLEQQEDELETNPMMLRFKESRIKMAGDPYRPIYHYVNPEAKLNDPNGLCFWQGRWHLFYQAYPPEYPRQHWGHAVSEDLIHWRDLPLAISPGPERACYSGSALDDDDQVYLYYASSDTRMHLAATSLDKLIDYVLNTPEDPGRTELCMKQRLHMIERNLKYLE